MKIQLVMMILLISSTVVSAAEVTGTEATPGSETFEHYMMQRQISNVTLEVRGLKNYSIKRFGELQDHIDSKESTYSTNLIQLIIMFGLVFTALTGFLLKKRHDNMIATIDKKLNKWIELNSFYKEKMKK